ncbi:MAG TPA: RecQ family ATP-dependent DNA helicase [Flavobacteriales bacterium]|nr:RecQ family ATP-dependent DNA helicase [Flavobacteriales bacterium]
MEQPLIIDLETDRVGKRLLAVGAVHGRGELHERKLDKLEPWLREARVLVGHNIVRHDAPFLRKRMGDAALTGKKLADTLCWSALLYADRPYHKLVKGYKLHSEDGDNNPLSDAKLCGQLLEDLLGRWHALPRAMQALYHALLHDRSGYDGFLQLAGATGASTSDASALVLGALQDKYCRHANLDAMANTHPVELAHALALIATVDEASVLPPWVVMELPSSVDILDALRFNPCTDPACTYCAAKLDPLKGLERIYGYPAFRRFDGEEGMGIQERSVRHALAGGSLLTIFPTGGGKSLTFQLPALMQGELTRALTVVVSPLVSLMKDQVEVLEDRFGNVQAVQLSSLLSPLERRNVLERIEQGGAHLLYVAPESLRSPTLFRLLRTRHIARFVVDEAHCFSAWGHDFRVDYLYIARFIRELMEAKGLSSPIPVSCFTATAKPQVIADIRDYFRKELGLELQPFISHARRENLAYEVIPLADTKPETRQRKLLQTLRECELPAIVYVSRTKRVDELVKLLATAGLAVRGYHGKLKREVKQLNQEAFMRGEAEVMVATNAFGMGVDKEDVRTVIHYNISASLENYVQEAGRAGRKKDIQARCLVLYHPDDLDGHFQLLRQSKLNQQEIDQIWRAIKRMTRFRDRVSKSALELATAAGWDREIKDLQNKVTASLAALEERGYLKRTLNSPQVFATSLLTKDLESALRLVHGSAVLTAKQKEDCARVLQRIIKHDETKLDEMAEQLGMELRQVMRTVQLLRELKVLDDHEDLTAFVDLRPRVGSIARLKSLMSLEKVLLTQLGTGPFTTSLRALNQAAIDAGVDSQPADVHGLLNYWKRRGFIRTARVARTEQTYRITPRSDPDDMRREMEERHTLAIACLDHLQDLATTAQQSQQERKEEMPVPFSMVGLRDKLREGLFAQEQDLRAVEKALLYLHEGKVINLEDGFMVIYQRLNVDRLEEDNRKRFTRDDYAHLDLHYRNRTEQIHMVGEYARKRSESVEAALSYVDDYFKLDHEAFIRRYFPQRRTEITRSISAERFRQLVGDLDTSQQAVVQDKSQHILVAAGPGSGKTRVLVHKAANLLLLEDVKPEQFLMLTYSRAAALELRSRIHTLVPEYRGLIKVTTFHSLCFELTGQLGDLEKSETVIGRAIDAIEKQETDLSMIANKSVIMLDEFQDVDADQWRLILAIGKVAESPRIIAVGDDDQNIYAWRGASPEFMAAFRGTFNATSHSLLTNYRSKATLVDLTNHLVEGIPGRIKAGEHMAAHEDNVGLQRVITYTGGFHTSGLVEDLIGRSYPGTTALLTRTNSEALMAASMLMERGVKARYVGGSDGFETGRLRELRRFMQLLRAEFPQAGVVPKELWLKVREQFLSEMGEMPLLADLRDLFALFDERYQQRYDTGEWAAFLREIRISDAVRGEERTVMVSTMHKAKGREFDNVFVLLDDQPMERAEDKRLLYVACTRAKERLVVHALQPFATDFNSPQLERNHDGMLHPWPEQLVYVAGMKDVNLGSSGYNQGRIQRLLTGDGLVPCSIDFANGPAPGLGTNDGPVVLFSRKFKTEVIERLAERGYRVNGGSVGYLVEWYEEEKKRHIEVVLPRVMFQRGQD